MTNQNRRRFVGLLVLFFFISTGAYGFSLNENPNRGPTTQAATPSRTASLKLVESTPSETSLDLTGIPNTTSVWKQMLRSADESIHLGMYYVNGSSLEPLEPITSLLEKKARNGVRVEVVSDSVFFSKYPTFLREFSQMDNTSVRILNLDDRTGGVMHGKYFVVDEAKFYVGSANFSWIALKHNRELGVVGSNQEVVDDLLKIFSVDQALGDRSDTEDWSNFKPLQPTPSVASLIEDTRSIQSDSPLTTLVATPPALTPASIPPTRKSLIQLINSAESEIFVDVFQYGLSSPYNKKRLTELEYALRSAALRGVKIQFMVSNWSLKDQQLKHLKSLLALPNVSVKHLNFPTHSEGYESFSRVSHTKAMLVDGSLAWIGSANWKPGYFTQSRNLGIVTNNPTVTSQLRQYFLTGWTSHYAIPLKSHSEPDVPYHW